MLIEYLFLVAIGFCQMEEQKINKVRGCVAFGIIFTPIFLLFVCLSFKCVVLQLGSYQSYRAV